MTQSIPRGLRSMVHGCVRGAVLALALGMMAASARAQQRTQPLVAVHDSELTRALETQVSSNGTPFGAGTTGNQWWVTNWHYFTMPESVKDALRSDGTAFTVIGDSNVVTGLTNANGSPKYPIIISLASEAIQNSEIAAFTNYVAAGGFLFVGSSSFTRNTNGATRTNFAFANELGVTMVSTNLTNWGNVNTFTKQQDHRIISHIPAGTLTWRLPTAADEISWGTSSNHPYLAPHLAWQVQATTATVLAQGDTYPYLMIKPYGKGYFIYYAPMQPLIGHGGWSPGMYSYMLLRKSIEWAFESAKLPVAKLSPWPYAYDSAFMVRHDLEDYADEMANILASAQAEASVGAKGDYFPCTGTIRVDMQGLGYNTNVVINNLRTAAFSYGATIGPHNGGLKNQNNLALTNPDFDYWHWGLDEALAITNAITNAGTVYSNGKAYGLASLSNGFADIESWLSGIQTNTLRIWVSPYFNSTRDDALDVESQLNVKITGDVKLSAFPSWTSSTRTAGKRYQILNIPVSDWFVNSGSQVSQIGQSMEAGHTSASIHALVDFYYNEGLLINLYCHTLATGEGQAGGLVPDYINYGLNPTLHPRVWSANSTNIYFWWLARSNAVVNVSYTNTTAGLATTTFSITGATDTNTSVEMVLPDTGTIAGLQITTNGALAGANIYRTNGQTLKIQVGTAVTNAVVTYTLGPNAQSDFYNANANATLTVSSPGVLGNDTPGLAGTNLVAQLVTGPAHGAVTLNTNGGFNYTPASNYTGMDSFVYQANDGQTNSANTTVTLEVVPTGDLFYDDFTRVAGADPLAPWIVASGYWAITNGVLQGTSDPQTYGFAYVTNTWTDYSVQAQVQVASGGYGGGIGGRLNPVTGAHYAAWLYPEGSLGGSKVLKLVNFSSWNSFTVIQSVNLSATIADTPHTLRLTMQGNSISVSFDTTQMISVTDGSYASGAISADMWTFSGVPTTLVENVIVQPISSAPVANNDIYNMQQGQVLSVPGAGVLTNDTGGSGPLTAMLVGAPNHGILNLSNNGGFTYSPSNTFSGTDIFTYQANDGVTNSAAAAVTINVNSAALPVVNNDAFTFTVNKTLTIGAPGVLRNDSDPNGSNLVAVLVTNVSHGSLTLNGNGSFTYIPAANFAGNDVFAYQAFDGLNNSAIAVVTLTDPVAGILFSDDFTRSISPTNLTLPWVVRSNNWVVTNGVLVAGTNANQTYGNVYVTNTWSNYFVQARMQFSSTNGYGGAIGGRVNTNNGAHYAAWIYPENSTGGSNIIKLVKFQDWTHWGYNLPNNFVAIATNSLPGVGTNFHTVKMAFFTNQIAIYYDGNQVISAADNDSFTGPYLNGGISLDMWTDLTNYNMTVDDVVVSTLPVDDAYTTTGTNVLNVAAPGVLANDTEVYGTTLNPALINPPANGTLTLSNNGGFSYTPTNSATSDSFSYQLNDGSANLGPATVTINRSLLDQTITFGSLTNHTWGDVPFNVSATASSGLPVSFSILSGPATINSGTVTITGTGLVTVRASQAGSSAYNPAPNVDQSFTVNPATLTVTANNTNRLYGQANPAFTAGYSGFVNGDGTGVLSGNPSLTTGATASSPAAGYPIMAAVGTLSAANYTFSFVNGTMTVNKASLTVTANNTNRLYGATNPVFTAAYGGFVNGDTTNVLGGSPSLTTTATTNSAVAGYTITAAAGSLSAANYTFSFVNGTLTVNKAALTVTANNTNRVYGATNPVFTASYSGFVNSDSTNVLGGSPSLTTAALTNSTAGGYTITAAVGTLSAANYTFGFVNGTLTVNKALLTVTANNTNRLYGATNPVFTAGYSGFVNSDTTNVLSGSPSLTTAALTNSPVAGYPIVATNGTLSAANYSFAFVNGTLNVGQATLTISANNTNRLYGATNPVFTAGYSGFVNGDTTNVLGGSPSLTTSALTNSPVAAYPIVATNGTLSSANYAFSFVNGTLSVGQATLTVTANNTNRLYGQTNPVFTASYSGFVNGDTTNVLGGVPALSTVALTNSPVGGYPILATNGTLSSANYSFSFVSGTLNVGAATLTVTANNTNRIYGATNPVFTASYSGFVNGDTTNILAGSPSLTTAALTNSPVAGYTIVAANGTLSAPNYAFSFVSGTLNVGAATLTVTANNTNRPFGQTNPVFTASYNGFVTGEDTTFISGSPALASSALTNSPVGPYPITITNGTLLATNYAFAFVSGTLTVGPATLTVTANNTNRLYGATNPVFTATYSGFINGDDTNVLTGSPALTNGAVTNSPVGSYPIVVTNGTLSATNYLLSFVNGNLTVAPAPLGVTANNTNRLYGQTNPVFTASYTGFVNGETTNVLAGSPSLTATALTNTVVGTYAIAATNGTLAATNYTLSFTNGNLVINPATLMVTANDTNRLYGATNPVFTAAYSGFMNGEDTNVLAGGPALATAATTNSPAGPYAITATNGTLVATNYAFSFANGTLNVGQATLTVMANNTNRAYGATNPVFTAGYTGFLNGDTTNVLGGSPSLTTVALTNSPVAGYPIVATNGTLSSANYAFSFVNGTLNVGQASLTVTANDANRIYGQTNPVFTAGYSGFVNGDTTNVLGGSPLLGTLATTNTPVGGYAITATNGTLSAANYSFTFINGTLNIGQAALTVTANNTNRLFGQTNPVFTANYAGFLNGDTSNILSGVASLTTTALTNSPVGAYPIVATNGTLAATNYAFTFANGTLTISSLAPQILSITGAGTTNVVVTWGAANNGIYRLQYSSDLTGTNWQNVVPDVTATNVTASANDNPGTNSQRFYRVYVVQ